MFSALMSIGNYGLISSGIKVGVNKLKKNKKKESSSKFSISDDVKDVSNKGSDISIMSVSPLFSFPEVAEKNIDEKSFKWCNEQLDTLKSLQESIISGDICGLNVDVDGDHYESNLPNDHIVSQIETRRLVENAKIKMSL